VQLRYDELKSKAKALGLTVQVQYRPAKAPYVAALREYFLKRDYPAGLPYTEISPMLCFPYSHLKPTEQNELWQDDNCWLAQEKLNGVRIVLHFVRHVGVFAHARTVNVSTFRRQELTDALLFSDFVPAFSAIIDGEVCCDKLIDTTRYVYGGVQTASSLQSASALLAMESGAARQLQRDQDASLRIHAFDAINWLGEDLRQKKLSERLAYLGSFKSTIDMCGLEPHFCLPEFRLNRKRIFFDEILSWGGEGLVFKNLYSPYVDSSSRSRLGWIKHKKRLSLCAFVSGFTRGRPNTGWQTRVATLDFSIRDESGKQWLVARVSNVELELRKSISLYDRTTQTLKLDPDCYGRVCEVSGQEFSGRAARLVHPTIDRWRPDLTQEQCVYRFSDLQLTRLGAIVPLDRVVS
jgi:ATP-dependent DNA ligase